MRVLVAFEFSGLVREAITKRGHDAWSCDLLPTEIPGNHFQCDIREIINLGWDMMIGFPPCTYTSYAGNRWFKVQPERYQLRDEGVKFFIELMNVNIPYIALENSAPRNYICKAYRKPDEIIQPYQFGHPVTKSTGLWLKNLPKLFPTNIVEIELYNWTKYKNGSHSGKERSRTFPGIAAAMAEQWG